MVLRSIRARRSIPAAALFLVLATAGGVLIAGTTSNAALMEASGGSGLGPAAATNPPPAASRLSPQQLAGERIVYAYAGLQPPASLLSAIRAGDAGGVIFFSNNIQSATQLRRVINQLQQASLASPVRAPLLMLTDQEGGEVRRLPGAPTLSEKQIGRSAHATSVARAAGSGAGQNLRAAGVNVNLAPVLDVYRQSGNFIDQFQRSYSSNAATVGSLGAAFIAAQQQLGVAATAKHFPGLGAAAQSQNTDLRPVTLRPSLSTLRSVDEAPYRNAIAAGVKLVMTSWAVYPALDSRLPAGLSSKVLQGELRGRLGFHGVTITDGIDAGALTPFGSLSRRAVQAASAGADLVLCVATNPSNNTPGIGTTASSAISAAIVNHTLNLQAAQQSAARILALRNAP
ncbi:MAG TPA: glycoside hydrolase family 3 N-terminal domain-containing protein [Solirubrobacteraceae bacterium]